MGRFVVFLGLIWFEYSRCSMSPQLNIFDRFLRSGNNTRKKRKGRPLSVSLNVSVLRRSRMRKLGMCLVSPVGCISISDSGVEDCCGRGYKPARPNAQKHDKRLFKIPAAASRIPRPLFWIYAHRAHPAISIELRPVEMPPPPSPLLSKTEFD